MADTGRELFYRTEDMLSHMFGMSSTAVLKGVTLTLPVERKFGAVETIQQYADHVLEQVADVYPAGPVRIRVGQKNLRARAYYTWETATIALPRAETTDWAWRELVVLHEIAHHLTPKHGHDSIFAGAFVHLLTNIIGPEAGWMATVLFADNGIRVTTRESTCQT